MLSTSIKFTIDDLYNNIDQDEAPQNANSHLRSKLFDTQLICLLATVNILGDSIESLQISKDFFSEQKKREKCYEV